MSGDPYLDLETGVLRNRLGITDAAELAQAESELTSYRLIELRRTGLPGRYDLVHLQAFHRYIFGDLYDWAGELRSVLIGWCDHGLCEVYEIHPSRARPLEDFIHASCLSALVRDVLAVEIDDGIVFDTAGLTARVRWATHSVWSSPAECMRVDPVICECVLQ